MMSQNTTFRIVMIFALVIFIVFIYNLFVSDTSCFQSGQTNRVRCNNLQIKESYNCEKEKKDEKSNNVKLIIYHMPECGHCEDIMKHKQEDGKTKFEKLKSIYTNDNNVDIIDYQLGRDKEADQFNAFPVIKIVKKSGSQEDYNGPRTVVGMSQAINVAKNKQ